MVLWLVRASRFLLNLPGAPVIPLAPAVENQDRVDRSICLLDGRANDDAWAPKYFSLNGQARLAVFAITDVGTSAPDDATAKKLLAQLESGK